MAAAGLSSLTCRTKTPSLTITVTQDGAILLDDQQVALEQVIARAELAKARREPIFVKHDYPPEAAPSAAVKLHLELIGHEILFQRVESGKHHGGHIAS